jgi:DNA-3-methyladenine glycosylase
MPERMTYSGNGKIRITKYLISLMGKGIRLTREFYTRDVLEVAPGLLGKDLVIKRNDGSEERYCISEVEAYRGEEDKACHASKGRTERTEIMYHQGGRLYIYLIYGMYWMLNIVTATSDNPQAVLIRGVVELNGPGRLTKSLGINKSFYGEDLVESERIWVEDSGLDPEIVRDTRIGIDYAGDYWKSLPWRYFIRHGSI